MQRTQKLLLVGLVTLPAAAFTFGGWAVTTVEDVPEYAVAGKVFELTWTTRQHGVAPIQGLRPTVTLRSGSDSRAASAEAVGEGVYRSRITIPSAGTWDVKINSGFNPLNGFMLPLKVVAANAPAPVPLSAFDRGHQLFVAKGCVTCHSHQLTQAYTAGNVAPDLTTPKFAAAYLTRFLANPSVKTDWRDPSNRMPNLGLKPAEITALVAFLNQEKQAR